MTILVTGAAGFIGSNLARELRRRYPSRTLISYDALTYAGSLENLAAVWSDPDHTFIKGDITDLELLEQLFTQHDITTVFHLAAETHVDRSILGPLAFVKTNVEGTAALLDVARRVWGNREGVRFVHVSTDEVFGSLGDEGAFDEDTPYAPRSPYSASKAASDHLARAYFETYGLPVLVTNCSNNYGPFQFPEKLLPVVVWRAIEERAIPIYGNGSNVRDWLHVSDHCAALCAVYERGVPGETYCIGGETELTNLELVTLALEQVDAKLGRAPGTSEALIRFVEDRPGHDYRYAMNIEKIRSELGWQPVVGLTAGLSSTVGWYVDNQEWCERVRSGESSAFEEAWYRDRLTTITGETTTAGREREPTAELDVARVQDSSYAEALFEELSAAAPYRPAEPTFGNAVADDTPMTGMSADDTMEPRDDDTPRPTGVDTNTISRGDHLRTGPGSEER